MTDFETILLDRKDRVGIITLNRPKALNALNSQLMREVVAAAQIANAGVPVMLFDVAALGWQLHHSGGLANPFASLFLLQVVIGAILLTGSEKAFAAGADIKEMAPKTFSEVYAEDLFSQWDRLSSIRKPIVAAVSGYALGGGCELAMLCDFIIASDTAKFGQPEIKLGVIPGIGGSQRLTRAVGKAKAMDMCLTGRNMDAEEAERAGLVSRVVPAAELFDVALEAATTIASMSLPVAMMAKEAVNRSFETTLAEGVKFERRVFHSTFATADQKEGMAAFVEKRAPKFEHA
ncbi:MAG: enoyl-CoA hydratase-related protein [Rhodococcus ruber]|nr:enoyl-CoA hydratase-related protein [Rhodococcus ruber]